MVCSGVGRWKRSAAHKGCNPIAAELPDVPSEWAVAAVSVAAADVCGTEGQLKNAAEGSDAGGGRDVAGAAKGQDVET